MERAISLSEAPPRGDIIATTAPHVGAQELCDTYSLRVFRFAAMISRGEVDAEDLAQDALERAIRALHTFDAARGTMDAWLWRIVVRVAADHGRLAKRRHLLFEQLIRVRHVPEFTGEPEPQVPAAELLAAVRALPPRDREIVALHFGAGLSYAEVGNALGISEAAAGVAGRRAVVRLRTRLVSKGRSGS